MAVPAGRGCAKQRGRLDRRQGWIAFVTVVADAMRRAKAPSRGCLHWESIVYPRSMPRVYVALGGRYGDCGDYHGWVVGTGLDGGGQLLVYQVPSKREAGIWAPSGIAVDSAGRLYVSTGNGASQSDFDHGDAVIRLDPSLHEEDWFAPRNFAELNQGDTDLGSTGPLLLDGGLVAVAGKDGKLYVLRGDHLGGLGGQLASPSLGGGAYGGMAAAAGTVLVPCADGLRAVAVDRSGKVTPRWKGPALGPPIVAAGAVWAVAPGSAVSSSRLEALDLRTGRELFTLSVGTTVHFATPTAASGRILVGAGDRVVAVATA